MFIKIQQKNVKKKKKKKKEKHICIRKLKKNTSWGILNP
jgi:hypothetical protein